MQFFGGLNQYVLYRVEHVPGEKPRKYPADPVTGFPIDANASANHLSYAQAYAALNNHAGEPDWGIGFVFTKNDPYWFLDIDNAYKDEKWSDLALDLYSRLPGCYVEVSVSGTGMHIFGRGKLPLHKNRNIPLDIELYTSGRFVALTWKSAAGSTEVDATAAMSGIIGQFFPVSKAEADAAPKEWTETPVPEWGGPADDNELFAVLMDSGKNSASFAFGSGVTGADLMTKNVAALSKRWPSASGEGFNASQADMALACRLAYWTGKNCERILKLMKCSFLSRPKWTERPTYLRDTIMRACSLVDRVAGAPTAPTSTPTPAVAGPTPEPTLIMAATPTSDAIVAYGPINLEDIKGWIRARQQGFLSQEDSLLLWRDLVYLEDEGEFWHRPSNTKLGLKSFEALYRLVPFGLENGKVTAKPWEAFAGASQPMTCVNYHVLDPTRAHGAIVIEGHKRVLNIGYPVKALVFNRVVRDSDVDPFLSHMTKLFPEEQDREIMLSWMAHVVQRPCEKSRWHIILQGVQGNGKSTLSEILREVLGHEHTFVINASDAIGQYTGWVEGKVFACIEEIHGVNKSQIVDGLKTLMTNPVISVNEKYKPLRNVRNLCNFILTTNHADTVPISRDERRYARFILPQQRRSDLFRDGLTSDFFNGYRRWLQEEDGFAKIGRWLMDHAINRAYDPRYCNVAPETTTERLAYVKSAWEITESIERVIDSNSVAGVTEEWVSIPRLQTELAKVRRRSISNSDLVAVMEVMGYEPQKALARSGMTGREVAVMVLKGSPGASMSAAEAKAAFQKVSNPFAAAS